MGIKYRWIKERENPQLGIYYVACGLMKVKDALNHERVSLYGSNLMHRFDTEEAYNDELARLKKAGERVQ